MRTRLYEIFSAALELGGVERERYLDTMCDRDPELRAAAEDLLQASEQSGAQIRTNGGRRGPLWQELAAELATADEVGIGDHIGLYRLRRKIGSGGMAVVYLAERADGEFDQQVALKLLKLGIDSEEVVRRFRQERQILASLNHPAIARISDGGMTASGRPYFAMEYVDGKPIDRYCGEQQLSVHERLKLFVAVARAVQYAHQNLVVHRDLKPSNILVTTDGQVKLLDFGIAKLLDERVAASGAPPTRANLRLMTPEYASPEQVRGEQVSIASDVYQLGLLLYRLLTGTHPYRLACSTPVELERAICDQEPRPPSAAVTAADEEASLQLPSIEQAGRARRHLSRLRRKLHGDLDTIVLQALRKEPERRYATAAELGGDIERYLAGRPVLAQKDTLGYRSLKFVQRHAVGVISVLIGLLLLAGALSYHTARLARERDRSQLEADKASQVAAFLKGLFEVSDPEVENSPGTSARELIDRGAERVADGLREQPEVQAEMMMVLGDIYRKLALYERATPLLEHSLRIRDEHWGAGDIHLVPSISALGSLHLSQGRYAEAEELFAQALEIVLSVEDPEHPVAAHCYLNLGSACLRLNKLPEAEAHARHALAIQEKQPGNQDAGIASCLSMLGWVSLVRHDYEEAEQHFRRGMALRERSFGMNHPDVAEMLIGLAQVEQARRKDHGEAEALYLEALEMLERSFGSGHPRVGRVCFNLATLRRQQGRNDEAEPYYRRAISIYERSAPEHSILVGALTGLAALLSEEGRYGESSELLERAIALNRSRLGPDHRSVAGCLWTAGNNSLYQGQADEAARLFQQALTILEKSLAADNTQIAALRVNLACTGYEQGRLADARQQCLAGLKTLVVGLDDGEPWLEDAHIVLARLHSRSGREQEAEEICRSRLAVLDRVQARTGLDGKQRSLRAQLLLELGDLHERQGEDDAAHDSWIAALAELDALPAGLGAMQRLDIEVRALLALGRIDQAQPLLVRLQEVGWSNRDLRDRCRRSGVSYDPI